MRPRDIETEVNRLREELAALREHTVKVHRDASTMDRSLDELRAALLMLREPYDDPVLAPEKPNGDED